MPVFAGIFLSALLFIPTQERQARAGYRNLKLQYPSGCCFEYKNAAFDTPARRLSGAAAIPGLCRIGFAYGFGVRNNRGRVLILVDLGQILTAKGLHQGTDKTR